jgi:hypothetical protein
MQVAVGFKAHSGWAAMVAVGLQNEHVQLVDRGRVSLMGDDDEAWARQPYHAAEGLPAQQAEQIVRQGVRMARERSTERLADLLEQWRDEGHDVVGCAVLIGRPMPAWSTAQILAVHIRMHQAEGQLFPDALAAAVTQCGIPLGLIREQELDQLVPSACPWAGDIASLGKWSGHPWGIDQKHAATAALVMFGNRLH